MEGALTNTRTIGIVGPTAIGKTGVGIEVCKLLAGTAEIVSVDSVQVYRHMDIGAAKPSLSERATARFCLIDIVDPDADFTLAQYKALAHSEIARVHAAGHVSLLVGGTGLYFKAITTDLDIPHTEPDQEFRDRWHAIAREQGTAAVRERLLEIDAAAAEKIHHNDVRRMIRAIEVYEKTGTCISEWHRRNRAKAAETPDSGVYFALDCDRDELYRTIERRVDLMIAAGLVDEVRSLRSAGYGPEVNSMQSLGYRQINDYLDGKVSLDEAVEATKAETRQFARRQLIWFRADKRLNWIRTDGQTVKQIAERILASVKDK